MHFFLWFVQLYTWSFRSAKFLLEGSSTVDKPIKINRIEFYEQAPETFDWINGDSGINNYPTKFGVRVLNNGI